MAKKLITKIEDLEKDTTQKTRSRALVLCSEQQMEWMQDHPVYKKLAFDLWFHTEIDLPNWTKLENKDFSIIVAVGEHGLTYLLSIYKARSIANIIHLTLCSTEKTALFYIAEWSDRGDEVEISEEELEEGESQRPTTGNG